jgi:hypothetical protein
MKFSFSLVASAALSFAIVSCSKEKTPAPAPVENPADKFVAVLKLNGNLSDSTGKITVGTTTGTPVFVNDRNGNPGSAVWLDGATKFEYPAVTLKGQSITMTAWVKAQSSAGLRHFVVALHPQQGGPSLYKTANKMGASVSVSNTNSAQGDDVNDQWHHLAMTYDGKDIRVFIDGTLASTVNHPGTMGDAARNLVVGAFNDTYWTGTLDEIRIYNKVLSNEAITALAAQ